MRSTNCRTELGCRTGCCWCSVGKDRCSMTGRWGVSRRRNIAWPHDLEWPPGAASPRALRMAYPTLLSARWNATPSTHIHTIHTSLPVCYAVPVLLCECAVHKSPFQFTTGKNTHGARWTIDTDTIHRITIQHSPSPTLSRSPPSGVPFNFIPPFRSQQVKSKVNKKICEFQLKPTCKVKIHVTFLYHPKDDRWKCLYLLWVP